METFCQRLHAPRDDLTFAARRPLVAFLIDCVFVNDTPVDSRYGVHTGPKGETTPFCHLRLDYLDADTLFIKAPGCLGGGHMAHQLQRFLLPFGPTTPPQDGTRRLAGDVDLLALAQ